MNGFTIEKIMQGLNIDLTSSQLEAVKHKKGPLLLIAGPGAGKTQVLIMRTLKLILVDDVKPEKILLCTFTEKAAKQLYDRLKLALHSLNVDIDISGMTTNTIHGFCNQEIRKNNHSTKWGKNYRVLDELSQHLFIYENFNTLFDDYYTTHGYLDKWSTKWTTIDGVIPFLNKITEELIDVEDMKKSEDYFVKAIASVYKTYMDLLINSNSIDFSFQQKIFYQLTCSKQLKDYYSNLFDYVMVDEYQDTNYVQEKLLFNISSNLNICVVGDEDQALYRFRGATVRNILEFGNKLPNAKSVKLKKNFRSHEDIVKLYNKFMDYTEWTDSDGSRFRYDKKIIPARKMECRNYQSVISIWGQDKDDEAKKCADFIKWLKTNNVISDYNQVAILMNSVREEYSLPYIQNLSELNIESYCPRARGFFENIEVRDTFAVIALILGYYNGNRGDLKGRAFEKLLEFIDSSIDDLVRRYQAPSDIAELIEGYFNEFAELKPGETTNYRLLDIFYNIISCEPFESYLKDENKARNISTISNLISLFQDYYGYTVITNKILNGIKFSFFNSFLKFLLDGGINEYEDPYDLFPSDHVQIMTMHQAKGLEFPVVIVGSLDKQIRAKKQIDEILSPFYKRGLYEPMKRISEFDRMRLFYTAFSRAENILALTCCDIPNDYILPVWEGLPQWPNLVDKNRMKNLRCQPLKKTNMKKEYSLTGDVSVYETCPRQYQFYKDYGFTPSRTAGMFFGTIVHQTIEDIHRTILSGNSKILNEDKIKEFYNFNYNTLYKQGIRPLSKEHRELAFQQCLRYYKQNQDIFKRIVDAEMDVSVEKKNYILTGVIDLLMGNDGKLEVLDFKSQTKPKNINDIEQYKRQLAVYADILNKKYSKYPEKAVLYWTGEEKKKDSIMVVPIDKKYIDSTDKYFDEVVDKIESKCYQISKKPDSKICNECDLRYYCKKVMEG